MMWKGEGRAYVSRRWSFTLDYSRNARQQATASSRSGGLGGAGGAGGPALEGELDFSALDDALLPLTTLADMCEH